MRRALVAFDVLVDAVVGAPLALPPQAAHRLLRVLRLADDDGVELFDGRGRRVRGTLQGSALQVDEVVDDEGGILPELVVVQAVVKTDKLEQVVRRATELGASAVCLFDAERGQVDLKDRAGKRVERLQRVAEDAARQSGRLRVPQVLEPLSLVELSQKVRAFDGVAVLGVVDAERSLTQMLAEEVERFHSGGALVVVGPEGGLSPREVAALKDAGARAVRLGVHVLRTETAALAALAGLQAALGHL